jgi:UDP-GlcNAc:undecaprenyl-phosphate/decaprenyl-phosphate GlcNAc-1-phosphate transferase
VQPRVAQSRATHGDEVHRLFPQDEVDSRMSPVTEALLGLFAAGLAVSLAFTGAVRPFARRAGLVDRPDGRRKIHHRAVPVAGGLAVFAAAVLVLAVYAGVAPGRGVINGEAWSLLGLLGGATIICLVGVADDVCGLRGRYKLAGQLAAVGVVVLSGAEVRGVTLFGWDLGLGAFALPFTALFLLGAINSLNLLDGMDGLLGTVGTIVCVAIAVLAVLAGHPAEACVAAALAGALIGFLRYNLPPASIFLGDAGSMLIGLVVGTLAIRSSLKGPATVALAAPAALLVIPIFDTAAALVRRKLTGRSIYTTDRGHIHHCLLRTGMSRPMVLLLVSGLCGVTVLGALGSIAYQNELLAVLSAAAVVAILIVGRLFGHAEFVLLVRTGRTLARAVLGTAPAGRQLEVRLQGSAEWSALWARLTACACDLNLRSMALDVNSPAHHEGYHARWSRPGPVTGEEPAVWSAVVPLTAWGQQVGQVTVTGNPDGEPVWRKLAVLTGVTDGAETVLAETVLAGTVVPAPAAVPANAPRPEPLVGVGSA